MSNLTKVMKEKMDDLLEAIASGEFEASYDVPDDFYSDDEQEDLLEFAHDLDKLINGVDLGESDETFEELFDIEWADSELFAEEEKALREQDEWDQYLDWKYDQWRSKQ